MNLIMCKSLTYFQINFKIIIRCKKHKKKRRLWLLLAPINMIAPFGKIENHNLTILGLSYFSHFNITFTRNYKIYYKNDNDNCLWLSSRCSERYNLYETMVWLCIIFVLKYFNHPLLLMTSFQGHVNGSITKCQIHWNILSINSSFVFSFFYIYEI